MKVIIAAAGTGGHINPGIAIANEIKKQEPNSKIIFIGTNRGLENDLVPRAGYELKTINAYGFDRTISLQNLRKMYQTWRSIKKAKKIIKKFKPNVVIGTGGYICVPVGLAAKAQNIPLVIHESNAFPGMAIKMLSSKANKVLVGFEDAKKRLPKAKEVIVTGTPTKVKKMMLTNSKKQELLKQNRLKESLPIVLCFGGSQGAQSINHSLTQIISQKQNKNYQIVWAAGPSQYEEIKQLLKKEHNLDIEEIENVKILPYIYNMEEMLNLVDLVVCRSGAMTITEIANVGKPAIFIPFPFATENHQEYNAKVLESVGAAKIILDKNLTAQTLNEQISKMVEDKNKLLQMGKKANMVATINTEQKIYQEVKKTINFQNIG